MHRVAADFCSCCSCVDIQEFLRLRRRSSSSRVRQVNGSPLKLNFNMCSHPCTCPYLYPIQQAYAGSSPCSAPKNVNNDRDRIGHQPAHTEAVFQDAPYPGHKGKVRRVEFEPDVTSFVRVEVVKTLSTVSTRRKSVRRKMNESSGDFEDNLVVVWMGRLPCLQWQRGGTKP